jgi:hypothetical protein
VISLHDIEVQPVPVQRTQRRPVLASGQAMRSETLCERRGGFDVEKASRQHESASLQRRWQAFDDDSAIRIGTRADVSY